LVSDVITVVGGAVSTFTISVLPDSLVIPTKATFTLTIIPRDNHSNPTNYNGTATITDMTGIQQNITITNQGWKGSLTATKSLNTGIDTITVTIGATILQATITIYIDKDNPAVVESPYGTVTFVHTGSLTESFRVTINDAKNYATFTAGGMPAKAIGVCIDVKLIGTSGTEFNQGFTLQVAVPYKEQDLGDVNEFTLRLYTFDINTSTWKEVPGSWVDTVNNIVYGTITHLTLIAPLGFAPSFNLNSVIVYPNPYKPHLGHTSITFAGLTGKADIRIFNIAGEEVAKFEETDADGIYRWQNPKLASGVYIYLITNNQKQKAIGKIGIVK